MYNCFKALSTDIVFNVLYIYIYIYIYFILFYIKYNIHIVKRFRAHCGFYAIENKLLLLLLLLLRLFVVPRRRLTYRASLPVTVVTQHQRGQNGAVG